MPRPTKLTPAVQKRIVAFLEQGAYVETAAAAAGISKSTLYDWMRRGGRGEEPYARFVDAVESAQARSDMRDLGLISKAAEQGAWPAAAWRLERKRPEQWGRRRVEVVTMERQIVGPTGFEALDDDELCERLKTLQAQAGPLLALHERDRETKNETCRHVIMHDPAIGRAHAPEPPAKRSCP